VSGPNLNTGDIISRVASFREAGDWGWNTGAPVKYGISGNPTWPVALVFYFGQRLLLAYDVTSKGPSSLGSSVQLQLVCCWRHLSNIWHRSLIKGVGLIIQSSWPSDAVMLLSWTKSVLSIIFVEYASLVHPILLSRRSCSYLLFSRRILQYSMSSVETRKPIYTVKLLIKAGSSIEAGCHLVT